MKPIQFEPDPFRSVAAEVEMENYLKTAGWTTATYYPLNWLPPKGPLNMSGMVVHRLKEAVRIQVRQDKQTIKMLRDRLDIVGEKE